MKKSAGILLYRFRDRHLEIFLVHPGGPLWQKKDLGSWSIPKGEFENEDAVIAAKREFFEETGFSIKNTLIALSPREIRSGKIVYAFASAGDVDTARVKSNLFEMEWPPNSAKIQSFPEVDKGEWFPVDIALKKINPGQAGFIRELIDKLGQNKA